MSSGNEVIARILAVDGGGIRGIMTLGKSARERIQIIQNYYSGINLLFGLRRVDAKGKTTLARCSMRRKNSSTRILLNRLASSGVSYQAFVIVYYGKKQPFGIRYRLKSVPKTSFIFVDGGVTPFNDPALQLLRGPRRDRFAALREMKRLANDGAGSPRRFIVLWDGKGGDGPC